MGELIFATRGVFSRYAASERDAVHDVTLEVATGELIGVVGPNGSGKTTLLRLLLGALAPHTGTVEVAGRAVASWRPRDLARIVGVVPQREEPAFPMRVRDAVMFGRYPYLGPIGSPSAADHGVVERALARCDVGHLARRWVATLSGGEWQRVRIARALAQAPRGLVLDEPTANLDIRHEMEVFELARSLVHDGGLAGLLVTHHVNLAARFVDRIVVMDRGAARAIGRPADVLTRELLEDVFEWPVHVAAFDGSPQIVPLRKGPTQR